MIKSSNEETFKMASVTGRCAVMPPRDYVACRFTEVAERHVFVCESKYVEEEKLLKRFTKTGSIVKVPQPPVSTSSFPHILSSQPLNGSSLKVH